MYDWHMGDQYGYFPEEQESTLLCYHCGEPLWEYIEAPDGNALCPDCVAEYMKHNTDHEEILQAIDDSDADIECMEYVFDVTTNDMPNSLMTKAYREFYPSQLALEKESLKLGLYNLSTPLLDSLTRFVVEYEVVLEKLGFSELKEHEEPSEEEKRYDAECEKADSNYDDRWD